MLSKLKLQPTPFRFLLYTEWVLLASCGSLAIVEAFEKRGIPVQHFLILLTLWGLGLALPMGNRIGRIVHTGLEIGLIFYGAMMGYLHILPMLYLIVAIRSCFLFAPPGRWTVAGLTFLLFLGHQIRYVQSIIQLVETDYQQRFWMHLIAETLMFALGLFLVLKLASALLSERELRTELTIAHKQLKQYAQQDRELAEAQERNRIARNLHDSLGHTMCSLNIQLQAAVELLKRQPKRVEPFLEQAQRLGMVAMEEIRQAVTTLREDIPLKKPLADTIADLVTDFQQDTGIPTKLRVNVDTQIPASVSHALYQIVKEALTNIYKHSQATLVEIEMETRRDVVQVIVSDDGQGFHRNGSPKSGFGLRGIQERVSSLKGRMDLVTAPGQGCQLLVEVPL